MAAATLERLWPASVAEPREIDQRFQLSFPNEEDNITREIRVEKES